LYHSIKTNYYKESAERSVCYNKKFSFHDLVDFLYIQIATYCNTGNTNTFDTNTTWKLVAYTLK